VVFLLTAVEIRELLNEEVCNCGVIRKEKAFCHLYTMEAREHITLHGEHLTPKLLENHIDILARICDRAAIIYIPIEEIILTHIWQCVYLRDGTLQWLTICLKNGNFLRNIKSAGLSSQVRLYRCLKTLP
jgi:hypothetical protein